MVNQERERPSKPDPSLLCAAQRSLRLPVRQAGLGLISSAKVAPERGRRLGYNRGRPLTT